MPRQGSRSSTEHIIRDARTYKRYSSPRVTTPTSSRARRPAPRQPTMSSFAEAASEVTYNISPSSFDEIRGDFSPEQEEAIENESNVDVPRSFRTEWTFNGQSPRLRSYLPSVDESSNIEKHSSPRLNIVSSL